MVVSESILAWDPNLRRIQKSLALLIHTDSSTAPLCENVHTSHLSLLTFAKNYWPNIFLRVRKKYLKILTGVTNASSHFVQFGHFQALKYKTKTNDR